MRPHHCHGETATTVSLSLCLSLQSSLKTHHGNTQHRWSLIATSCCYWGEECRMFSSAPHHDWALNATVSWCVEPPLPLPLVRRSNVTVKNNRGSHKKNNSLSPRMEHSFPRQWVRIWGVVFVLLPPPTWRQEKWFHLGMMRMTCTPLDRIKGWCARVSKIHGPPWRQNRGSRNSITSLILVSKECRWCISVWKNLVHQNQLQPQFKTQLIKICN